MPQVGVSRYRIDLGVVHPQKPGAFLAGIECDGATYHRSATARDRDKLREEVLRGLGWSILRIWSPDWWYDARTVTDRIHESLRALLEESREKDREVKKAALQLQRDAQVAEDSVPDNPDIGEVNSPLPSRVSGVPGAGR